MQTRDLIEDDQLATAILAHGFEVMDAETLIVHAPNALLKRLAANAGCINRVTIWDTQDPAEGFALTMENTSELVAEWRNFHESLWGRSIFDDKPEPDPSATREYTMDVKLFATVTVTASTQDEAERKIKEALDGAEAHFGAWEDNGDPILSTVSTDGTPVLMEIDGEAV